MLNRLYIVIGLLAIMAISAAFIVPRFVQWGDYRERMQTIGSEVLGAPVEIVGEIEFALLPQPKLLMSEVVVGGNEQPSITVSRVEARFSLIDFLRDYYRITELVLEQPVVELQIDSSGRFSSGLALAEKVTASNISVASAQLVDGTVRLSDDRSDESFIAAGIDGELRLDALRGPFAFQGSGDYGGETYAVRITTDAMDAEGKTRVAALVRQEQGLSLSSEGTLATGAEPRYSGTMTYRQSPARGGVDDAGRGDFVVSGQIEATPARILLSDYTVLPDENRAATRLQGAAEITLGSAPAFNAVVSGASVVLPPRDATAEKEVVPYELVRLLGELPLPLRTGLPGSIGVDISEVDLRAVSLRNVRVDATTDGTRWQFDNLSGQLPGGARVRLTGQFSGAGGNPNFSGEATLSAPRLWTLAELWRRPAEGNPLLNTAGTLAADVSLVGGTLSLRNAVLTVGEVTHRFATEIGFATGTRHLNVSAELGAMDAAASEALLALLPDLSADQQFGVTFPKGRLELTAEAVTVAGLEGTAIEADGNWDGGVLVFDRLAAEDFGGAAFDVELTAFGTLARPELSGRGRIAVAEGDAPLLARLLETTSAPAHVRRLLERSAPYELNVRIDAPSGDGGQGVAVNGRVGVADLTLHGQLGAGLLRALDGPMAVKLDLQSEDAQAMTAQLGLGDTSIVAEGSGMQLAALIDGTAANSFASTVRLSGGGDSIGFSGNVLVGDPERWTGSGTAKLAVSDPSVLMALLGAEGISVPAFTGTADVAFAAGQYLRAESIEAVVGGQQVSGELALAQAGETAAISGELSLGRLDAAGLLAVLAGPAALIQVEDSPWPDGPLEVGGELRSTSGRVAITTPRIDMAGNVAVTDAMFDVDWDGSAIRLRELRGDLGGGRVTLDLALCCSGPLQDKQVSARISLQDVALDDIAPPAVAAMLEGKIDASGRFSGTGDSVRSIVTTMTGEGSYLVEDLVVAGIDPTAFAAIGDIESILDLDREELSATIIERLDDGSLAAAEAAGGFTVAGGVLRSPNLAIEGQGARLFGSTTLRLADFELGGSFVMSPEGEAVAGALEGQSNAQIVANLKGSVAAPVREFDVSGLVDGLMVRAYEVEVARLERLRAEDEARQRAAAEERARLAAELQAQRAEEEARREEQAAAERRAAEEEAARRQAEEEAAARRAEERRAEDELRQPFVLQLPSQTF